MEEQPQNSGKKKATFFLPWIGEFGFYICLHTRKVQERKADYKIVACKKHHECLFPSADEFFYDWNDILDCQKKGASRRRVAMDEIARLMPIINERYSEYDLDIADYYQGLKTITKDSKRFRNIIVTPKFERLGLNVDVVVSPRSRGGVKDYTHWQEIVNAIVNAGYSVGVVGVKETTQHLDNISICAWDHVDVESDIEMIQNSKLVIATDTGPAHLAVLCRKPMICFKNPDQKFEFTHVMRAQTPSEIYLKFLDDGWNDYKVIVNDALTYLESVQK